MARYTFICEHLEYDMFRGEENAVASKHTTEFNGDDLNTMLENFELFLRGAGFHFDGKLDIVNEEDDCCGSCDHYEDTTIDSKFDFTHIPNNNWPFTSSQIQPLTTSDIESFTMQMPGTTGSATYVFSSND